MARIAFAGNKTTTYECMKELLTDGSRIDLLITLTPDQGTKNQVAGYMDLRSFADKHCICVYHPEIYSLKSERDRVSILSKNIDCLIVIGWQRLIPEWLLENLRIGAFGMHGSPEPLPRGRGRSPLDWSILNGKTSFLTHLFRYDIGVDSGGIVDFQKFEINPWDDCESLHFKNRISMCRLLKKHLPNILTGKAKYNPQPTDIEPTYFPKRSPEDGLINWMEMDMMGLYNHVRCQTRPFPGAFSFLPGHHEPFYFYRVVPFDGHLIFPDSRPGTVVEVFHDSSFLVAVWDGSVRVIEYTSSIGKVPDLGSRFVDNPTN